MAASFALDIKSLIFLLINIEINYIHIHLIFHNTWKRVVQEVLNVRKEIFNDGFIFFLSLHDKELSRPLYTYGTEPYKFSCTKGSTSTIVNGSIFHLILKVLVENHLFFFWTKLFVCNLRRFIEYVKSVTYFNHSKFVFSNK